MNCLLSSRQPNPGPRLSKDLYQLARQPLTPTHTCVHDVLISWGSPWVDVMRGTHSAKYMYPALCLYRLVW